MIERFYSNKELILTKSLEFFKNSNSTVLKIGCELEFFLLQNGATVNDDDLKEFISKLAQKYQVEKERGESQIEVKFDFTEDLEALSKQLEICKLDIENMALESGFKADFSGQIFANDCGNALQFNISLHDKSGNNLFLDYESLVKNSANSLLAATNKMMLILAPKKDDYLRFDKKLNIDLFAQGKFTAPVNLSFGADNRSCAIRVVKSKIGKRLEYRIPCARADVYLAIAAIIISLQKVSAQKFEQVFGNAFDEKYQLDNLCKNLDEAEEIFFSEDNFIRKTFDNFLRS